MTSYIRVRAPPDCKRGKGQQGSQVTSPSALSMATRMPLPLTAMATPTSSELRLRWRDGDEVLFSSSDVAMEVSKVDLARL